MLRLYVFGISVIEMAAAAMVLVPPLLIWGRFCAFGAKKLLAYCLFALYMAAVCSVTGLPGIANIQFDPSVNLIPFLGMAKDPQGVLLNALMLLPLGLLLPVIWERYSPLKRAVLYGLAVTLTVEILQLFTFRTTDINDVIANLTGVVMGHLLGRVLVKRVPRLRLAYGDDRDAAILGAAAFAAMCTVQQPIAFWLWELAYSMGPPLP